MSKYLKDFSDGMMSVTVEGQRDIERELGELRKKTPNVVKNALNSTAMEARTKLVKKAQERYDIKGKTLRGVHGISITRASNKMMAAFLHIKSYKNDLIDFNTNPKTPVSGLSRPAVATARVLKESGMKPLSGGDSRSKAFVVRFKSGHLTMVERDLSTGSHGKLTSVMGLSASGMLGKTYHQIEPQIELILARRVQEQISKMKARG